MSNSLENNHVPGVSTVDDLLEIDGDDDHVESSANFDLDTPVTKHTLVTSPWSRLVTIAVPFGLGFGTLFLLLNGVFNPHIEPKIGKKTDNSPETADLVTENDGSVYAQLALSEQQQELSKINKGKKPEPRPVVNKTQQSKVSTQPIPASPRPTFSPRSVQPPPKISNTRTISPSPVTTKISAAVVKQAPVDPNTEFNRLRNIGSYGTIAYSNTNLSSKTVEKTQPSSLTNTNNAGTKTRQENTNNSIEKILPRWQVSSQTSQPITLNDNYLSQEKQILQQQQTRYLTVGKFANGVLVTPVVKPQTKEKQTDNGRRFVARLTQDLKDNNGQVAIPTGTLLAVEVVSVEDSNYAQVQVTSIIQDKTEYPISAGAISVQGDGGKPLIAQKFQDKGGEIAQYDLTVGLVGGLAKVGEIINQPDVQQSIQTGFVSSFSNTSIQNNRRNIGGAFLQGAFGNMGDIISRRAERSTQEILARSNIWFIPQGTKVTFIVNRTLELGC